MSLKITQCLYVYIKNMFCSAGANGLILDCWCIFSLFFEVSGSQEKGGLFLGAKVIPCKLLI